MRNIQDKSTGTGQRAGFQGQGGSRNFLKEGRVTIPCQTSVSLGNSHCAQSVNHRAYIVGIVLFS